ncbi:1,4-dihydroxy-2-naphthoate prenyltransferase [Tenacibaculum sp. Bg11-29]|uniref:SRPBCC family protein n=1 Tax=Tenacibaculum sp. Bg11-29 TaxID=2058306 RepID=UPI000C3319A1|nr:SRPBCC family protein [Tenacibaculum sp. Bg11-29]PKH51362.1 1,4-dihydroxy-2-naphthoate prenyltransferase [Tenacibaculum sp. Bg11-29]
MKAVKIVLGIVTAFVLVFLLTGIIVTEVKYTAEIEINKPINEVFKNFENVDFMKKWLPEVKSIEPIEEKKGVLGSTYAMTVINQGQEMKMVEKITAYIPNEKMTFQFDSDQMTKIDDYNFIANGNKTKMIQNCSVNSKSYMTACLFPYFKGTFKNLSLSYMKRFKEEVEK